jgi:hypothetical protein
VNPPKDNASGTEGLEELESDAIVAQETSAHAPQRRANVQVDQPSVVIAEHAPDAPPRRRRGSNDKTLVIRDRRAVDEVRKKIAEDQARRERARKRRVIAIWVLGAVTAFGLGSAFALYWGDDSEETAASAAASVSAAPAVTPSSEEQPSSAPVDSARPSILDLDTPGAAPAPSAAPTPTGAVTRRAAPTSEPVNLEQLPVEKSAEPPPKPAPRKRATSPVVNELPF